MSNELFNQDNPNNDENNPLESLVGEGKKFATVEDMAKGKLESDRYIEELKAKLESMEDTNSKLDTFLEKVGKSGEATSLNTNSEAGNENSSSNTDESTSSSSVLDVEALVEAKIKEKQEQDKVASNLDSVRSSLESKYGKDAQAFVAAKAKELGMQMSTLDNLAANEPTAFMRLMGETGVENPSVFKSSVNSESFTTKQTVEKGWSHFREMKKNSPSRFYSQSVQKELNDIADKVGADVFFSN